MNNKLVRITVVIFSLLIISIAGSACGKKDDRINVWIGGSIIGENEVEEPQESWIIQKLLNEYAEKYNKEIKLTYFEDEEAMVHLVANNSEKENEIPDIACLYSSEILREMSDAVYPIKKYVTEEEKQHIMFWETVTDEGKSIEKSQEVLGYPIGGTEVTFIGYNKNIFKQVGINVEKNPPKTFGEFKNICEKLYQHNILPIVASSDGWNELYVQLFAKEWMQYIDDATITKESKGEKKYSDDAPLIKSLDTMKQYYSSGYINKDYATNEDATTLFANGKAAMFSCSNYDIKLFEKTLKKDFGVFCVPDYSNQVIRKRICFGGCNQCLSVTKKSKHKKEAIKLIQWLSNKRNNIRMTKKFGCFPNRNDVKIQEYDKKPNEIIKKVYKLLPYAHCTADYLMPMDIYDGFYRNSLDVIMNKMDSKEFVKRMDKLTHEK